MNKPNKEAKKKRDLQKSAKIGYPLTEPPSNNKDVPLVSREVLYVYTELP
jgi:hypothetical protein